MSYELAYFPPNGTKYKWGSKPLRNRPWRSNIWEVFPARISAQVDLVDGQYKFWVNVTDFSYSRHDITGSARTALEACLQAEKIAEEQRDMLWRPWMAEALAAKWRPPT